MLGCWLVSRNLAGGWALNCRLQGNALIEGSGDLAQTETQQSWLASRAGAELGLGPIVKPRAKHVGERFIGIIEGAPYLSDNELETSPMSVFTCCNRTRTRRNCLLRRGMRFQGLTVVLAKRIRGRPLAIWQETKTEDSQVW